MPTTEPSEQKAVLLPTLLYHTKKHHLINLLVCVVLHPHFFMCLSERNSTPHDQLGQELFDCTNIGLDPITNYCDYINLDDLTDLNCAESDLTVMQLNIRGLISKQNDLSKLITSCFKEKKD